MKFHFSAVSVATLLGALLIPPSFADANAEAFQVLDADGDGFISPDEALVHAVLPDAFTDGDENSDGLLDIDEFGRLEISND